MTNRTLSAILLLIAFTLHFTTPALALIQVSQQDEPLLTIDGVPVDKEEMIYQISKGKKSEPGMGGLSREEFEENLNLFINFKLKVREAETQKLDETEDFHREFESFKQNLIAPFLIRNSLEEGELRKSYSRMQEAIRASHILLQFPQDATKSDSMAVLKMALSLKKEVENGANINTLAVEYSDDPSAEINKGDLGFFTALQMLQPFEDAAYTLAVGEVSSPVLTNYGYHIIQVKDRIPNPGQVRVSHILVRIDETLPNGEDQAKRKVADIYREIQKENTVWEDIVLNYSEDPASSQQGGLLSWFTVGSVIPEVEIAAFSLTEIGEVSPPVRTQYGYHILRLEDRRPLKTFDELEESIRSRILRDSRSTMIQSQEMSIQKSRYSFDEDEATVCELKKELDSLSKNEIVQRVKEKQLQGKRLFILQEKEYTLQDLISFIDEKDGNNSIKNGNFNEWYFRFIAERLDAAEVADLSTNNTEYQMLLKEYHDGILLFSLMNDEVWQKGLNDSIGQRAFYKKNIKNYQWSSRVDAYVVKVLDINHLTVARKALENQTLSPELINSFESEYKSNAPLAFQTESGIIEYENHPILSQIDLDKSYQEIEINGHLHLILLADQLKAGPKEFEETLGLVIRDYQQYLDNSLIESLKKKYPVKVYPKAKEETFVALNH